MNWTVADVMTKDPVTVGSACSFKTCANLMRIHELSAVPVVGSGGKLMGIVSEADLLAKEAQLSVRDHRDHVGKKAKAMTVGELMTSTLVTTRPDTPLATAASLMFEHRLKVLPVVDTKRRLVGIVSRSQVLKVFLRSDESIRKEVVGDLSAIPQVPHEEVEVDVREGVVHLYGKIAIERLTELINRLVLGVPGVVGVVNHPKLSVEPAVAAGVRAGRGDAGAQSAAQRRRASC